MDMEQFVGLAVAVLGLCTASILIQWSQQKANEKEWREQWRIFALREKYLLSQLTSLRTLLARSEKRRLKREIKHAQWREMAGEENQASAQALIDVDDVNENEAAIQRLELEEMRLRDEADSLGYEYLYINVMEEDRYPPGMAEEEFDRWEDRDSSS